MWLSALLGGLTSFGSTAVKTVAGAANNVLNTANSLLRPVTNYFSAPARQQRRERKQLHAEAKRIKKERKKREEEAEVSPTAQAMIERQRGSGHPAAEQQEEYTESKHFQ